MILYITFKRNSLYPQSLTYLNIIMQFFFAAEQKKSLLLEKESIQELKAELLDYSEDVEEMHEIVKSKQADIKLTKGARRYGHFYFIFILELHHIDYKL